MEHTLYTGTKHRLSCFGLACDTRQWQLRQYQHIALEAVRECVAAIPSSYSPQMRMPAGSMPITDYHNGGPWQAANRLQH